MPFADIDDTIPDMIRVNTTWNEKELIQQVPGSSYRNNAWRVPLTWAACVQLRGIFGERLLIGENLIAWAQNLRMEYVNPASSLRERLTPEKNSNIGIDRLFPFQRAAVDFMLIPNRGLLGDEMGSGKTIEMLCYLAALADKGKPVFPAIIICPNSLKLHWAARIPEWVPGATPYVISGTQKNRQEMLEFAALDEKPVIIINYELLRTMSRLASFGNIRLKRCTKCDRYGGDESVTARTCEVHPKPLNYFGFRTVILDEAHRIKDPKSQQTRAAWAVCHDSAVEQVWALTGTPIANHVGELWSVMHAVAPKEYPTKSKFTDRYALAGWNEFGALEVAGLDPAHETEFRSFFNPRFRRVTKDMVLPQLPPKTHTVRMVDMTPQQGRMYAELESSLMCRTADGELWVVQSQLAAVTRLSQLACSSVKIIKPDERDISSWIVELKNPSPKIDELMQVISELGDRQAVVAAEYSKLIDLACDRLTAEGISHAKITGEVSPYDRQKALDALNAGHIQILLFTTKAGGVGLDMSAASCLIWLQHPWSMIEYLQAEDRVRRIGSERHAAIDIVHIVTDKTIEDDKIHRLQDKLHALEEIVRDRDRMRAAGMSTAELDRAEETLMTAFLGVK